MQDWKLFLVLKKSKKEVIAIALNSLNIGDYEIEVVEVFSHVLPLDEKNKISARAPTCSYPPSILINKS